MEPHEGFVNAKFFEEQRREMVAAIRAIAEHMAPQTAFHNKEGMWPNVKSKCL